MFNSTTKTDKPKRDRARVPHFPNCFFIHFIIYNLHEEKKLIKIKRGTHRTITLCFVRFRYENKLSDTTQCTEPNWTQLKITTKSGEKADGRERWMAHRDRPKVNSKLNYSVDHVIWIKSINFSCVRECVCAFECVFRDHLINWYLIDNY